MPSIDNNQFDVPVAKRQKLSFDQNGTRKPRTSASKIFYPFRVGALPASCPLSLLSHCEYHPVLIYSSVAIEDIGIGISHRSSA